MRLKLTTGSLPYLRNKIEFYASIAIQQAISCSHLFERTIIHDCFYERRCNISDFYTVRQKKMNRFSFVCIVFNT